MGIIYKITNQINQKIYVGLTRNSLQQRFSQHKYDASHGVDRPLYRAMRKYGIDNFTIEAIDSADDLSTLKQKEQYWIQFYDSYGGHGHGYNATKGGDVRTHPPVAYSKFNILTGELIESFEQAYDCNQQGTKNITQNADKITYVQYVDYIVVKTKNLENMTPEEVKQYIFSLRPHIICQLDKDNNLIERFINSSDVLKKYPQYTKSCIFDCLHNRRKTHLGYQWKYYEDYVGGETN